MTLKRPWIMQASGGDAALTYSGLDIRSVVDAIYAVEGVVGTGALLVAQRAAGANFSVDVAAGFAVIQGDDTSNQGKYLCQSTAVENVVIPSPPVSGSRIHRVIARVKDKTHNGAFSTYEWTLECQEDTGSGTPALPASAIPLALVTVASTDTSVLDAKIDGSVRATAQTQSGDAMISMFRFADSAGKTNNTLADDSDLTATVPPGIYYELTGQLIYSTRSDTDFKFRLVGPTNATFDGKFSALLPSATGISGDVPHDREVINVDYVFGGEGANNTTYMVVSMSGVLFSGDGGTFKVQWAQNATNATATYLRGKSFITLRRVR